MQASESHRVPVLAIVVPCYNEEEALPLSSVTLLDIIDQLVSDGLVAQESYIMCCDDGSTDNTWDVIMQLHQRDSRIHGIKLAHNRGHQYALLAGLMSVKESCDLSVSIDADLQDDPSVIRLMVEAYLQGAEIVYGVRKSRQSDSWFKRTSAHAFYSLQRAFGLKTIFDHADYRLLSARALEMLSQYGESNLFLRGIIPQLGLSTAIVEYDRNPRVAGESKYPLTKMISFSIDGITSFTARPIRLIFMLGIILLILDIAMGIYVLSAYFAGTSIAGWASLMLSIWFLGSLVLISLGVVGEYVGKIFVEVKARPRYYITDKI